MDRVYTIGFCMGGRLSFLSGTFDKNLAGVIGFYGWPVGAHRTGSPAPADVAADIDSPVLAIFGGADEGIQPAMVETFETALDVAAVPHKVIGLPERAAQLLRPQVRRVLDHVGEGVGRGPRLHPRRPGGLTWASCGGSSAERPRPTTRRRRRRPSTRRPPRPTKPNASGRSCAADQARLNDELLQRQLRYADRSWTPPAQGGTRRSDDEGAPED